MIGKTISHYEIVDKLGQGGMGVVYKAKDTRLARFVALKMLSPECASDEKRKKRLLREAQAASSLNHPNICTIYEIDEADGMMFVAMELLEGHTLTEELSRGALSLEKTLDLAIQVAEALEKAHQLHVVHRDIKPSNIMITKEGRAKVVDFGLARAVMQSDSEMLSQASTMAESLTETGQIIGTIHFMSPEQIRGENADARSDVFSFGVVLYAMVTGILPFQGTSTFEVMSSILHRNPQPVHERNTGLPEGLDRIIVRALAKSPADRYPSMGELLLDLRKMEAELRIPKPKSAGSQKKDLQGAATTAAVTERRHVTMVVSHLVAYAELIENLGPAAVVDFLKRICEIAEEIVAQLDGTLNKFTGEEIVILCGVPTAHEDDSLRAVRAVHELHARVRELSPLVESRIGQPLCLQSGISAGLAVAEFLNEPNAKYRLTGNVAQLATRLAEHADADEILVSPECRHLIAPYFETEATAPLPLRSKAPVTPYRILRESGLQSRLEAVERAGFTPFTGREKELRTLENCFEIAQRGEGQFVTVVGEAGIGKSRLLYEFRNRLDPKSTCVLQGRCHSHRSNVSYVPFIDALRDLLPPKDDDPSNTVEEALLRISEIGPSLKDFIPIYLHLLSVKSDGYSLPEHLQGEELRLAIREALSAIFILRAQRTPVVLILEDWQWADDASQHVLKQLAEMIPGFRILIVIAHRTEASVNFGSLPNYTPIHLSPLDTLLSLRIIKSVLGASQFPEDLAKLIHDRTGGNPFFLEEVCHTLREEGTIRVEDGKVSVAGALDQFRLPDRVEAVIQTRLGRLSPEDQEVVRFASVIGREFRRGILQHLAGGKASLLRSLENLRSLGLIQQISVLPEAVYSFKHAFTQQVAYESLLQHRRKDLHGIVGRAMEDLYFEHLAQHVDVLAYHFSQAELWEKACHYGLQSAQNASKLGQFAEALELHEKVHAWLLKLPDQQKRRQMLIDNLLNQERLCETLGKRERQQQLIDELRSILVFAEDQAKIAEVERRQGDLYTLLGRFDAAEEALQKSLAVSKDLSDFIMERSALSSLGFLRWHQGRDAEAAEINEKVLSMDRNAGELQSVAGDLTNLGNVLRHLGDHQRALECLEEALEIYERKSDPVKQVYALHIAGNIHQDLGDLVKALAFLKRGSEVCAKHHLFITQGFHLNAIANIYWQQGKWEESLQLHKEVLALNRKTGHADGLAQSLRIIGETLLNMKREEEALPYFLESADFFVRLGDRDTEARMRMSAAKILEQKRDFEQAMTNWTRVRDLKRTAQDEAGELEAWEGMARVNRLGGNTLMSLQYYKEAMNLAEKMRDQAKAASILNSMGILEWNRGEYERALQCYERALKLFEELGDQVHTGLMLNSIGVTLTRLNRLEGALASLKRAADVNRQTKEHLLEGHAWAALGEVWYKMDDREQALSCYENSLQIRRQIGDRKGEGWMLYYLARLQELLGAQKQAEDSLAEAVRIAAECADEKLIDACRSLHLS